MTLVPARAPSRTKASIAFSLLIRLVLPGLAFAYLFRYVDAEGLGSAVRGVSASAAAESLGWIALGVALGVARWRVLLQAGGAQSLPSWSVLSRLYLVGMFYNLLPGAVGGDVYRAYATRQFFAENGTTRSLSVVMMERVLGLAGLFAVAAAAALASPFKGLSVLLYAVLGLVVVAAAMLALLWGRFLIPYVPALAGRALAMLPVVERFGPLWVALLLSVATQIVASMNGYAVLRSLVPDVSFIGAMAIFPLGTLASYFPFTVAGAGARDTALALLLAKIGVERADSLATSLLMLAGNVLVSSVGGLMQLAGVQTIPAASSPEGGSIERGQPVDREGP